MLGQLRNEIGKRGVTSSSDAAADEELVAAAKNGDELGFESLAKRHQRRIFALAFRYTRVREDAEDIVQETLQKAFVHLQKFEGKSSFSTWLTRIAINEALMSLRRRRAEVPRGFSGGPELRSGWYMTELTLDWQLSSPVRQRAQLSPPPVSSFGFAR